MVVINPGRGPGVWPRQAPPDALIDTADTGAKMVPRAMLICRPNSHPFQARELTLDKPEKIGRSLARVRAARDNAIFDCRVLSRNHALLWFENGKFFLQDTKSSNGTFVNSQRLGKGADESPPRELCSGDVVQFGVDVMENAKQVAHGCIVATLLLYLPDGNEAKTRGPASDVVPNGAAPTLPSPAGPIQSGDLYQLQQCVQEAMLRERAVEHKLAMLQRLMEGVQTATSTSWKALVDEDRLLTRLEKLEGQHAIYSKNFGEDKLREEIVRLQEEKNAYQNVAKESLRKVLQEKLEAVRKLQELERTVTSAEDECKRQTQLRKSAALELVDLAAKYETKQSAVTNLENRVKELEEEQTAAEELWETERSRLEANAAQQRADEAQQRARLEDLQAETDFTKQQLTALRQKLQTKVSGETTPNGDIATESGGMQQTEQELAAVRSQLTAAETQLNASVATIARLRDDVNRAEADIGAFKEKAAAMETELGQAKAEAAKKREAVQQLEGTLKEKEGQLAKMEKQRSAGDADTKESQADVTQLRNEVQSVQELLEEARTGRKESDSQLERCESELLVTRNNGQEATLRADHLRSQLKEAEASLAVRSERTEQLQQTVVRLAASVTEAVGQLHSLQQRYDQSQRAAADERVKADQLHESLTAAEQRATESSAETAALRTQLGELRAELETVRANAEERQRQLDSTASRLQQLQERFKVCEEERDAALARCLSLETAAAQLTAAPPGDDQPDAADEAEKADLRRQLHLMDEQLKELAVQNRTMDTSNIIAVAVLVMALFITLLVINS